MTIRAIKFEHHVYVFGNGTSPTAGSFHGDECTIPLVMEFFPHTSITAHQAIDPDQRLASTVARTSARATRRITFAQPVASIGFVGLLRPERLSPFSPCVDVGLAPSARRGVTVTTSPQSGSRSSCARGLSRILRYRWRRCSFTSHCLNVHSPRGPSNTTGMRNTYQDFKISRHS